MDDREKQRIKYTERNERNKIWHKRLKIYYTGAWGMLLLELLLVGGFFMDATHSMIWLYVMGVLFVVWLLWCSVGSIFIRCPHCDSFFVHTAPGGNCCPYCGTKLDVFPDLEALKEEGV